MDLQTHIESKGETPEIFAAKIPVRPFTVRRWMLGDRVPTKALMPRVVEVTDGQVTPNDFFERAKARRLEKASRSAT